MSLYAQYAALLDGVLDDLVADGVLPAELDRSNVTVEPPRDPAHGDLATNAAMVLAKGAGTNPRALAEAHQAQARGAAAGDLGRDRRAWLHQPPAGSRRVARRAEDHPRAKATNTASPRSARTSGSMSNMSRPTRPGRCTWAIAAARWSATASPGCSKRRASASPRNIMSTMPARRSIRSPARSTCATARRSARTSATSPRACIRAII